MNGNAYEMLIVFFKLLSQVFLGFETEDTDEFILDYYGAFINLVLLK